MVGVILLLPSDAASQQAAVGSTKSLVVVRVQTPRNVVVDQFIGNSAVSIRGLVSEGALGQSYSSRVFLRKLQKAFRMHRSTLMYVRCGSSRPPEVYKLVPLFVHL